MVPQAQAHHQAPEVVVNQPRLWRSLAGRPLEGQRHHGRAPTFHGRAWKVACWLGLLARHAPALLALVLPCRGLALHRQLGLPPRERKPTGVPGQLAQAQAQVHCLMHLCWPYLKVPAWVTLEAGHLQEGAGA